MNYFKVIILLLCCLLPDTLIAAEELLIYWPTEQRTRVIQKEIVSNCPEFRTLAFGRSVDFYIEAKERKPLAVISFDIALDKAGYGHYKKGYKNNKQTEDYILFGFGSNINLNQLDQVRVGAVDILGREKMETLIQKLLHASIEFVRVVKVEDIIPLINFDYADIAFVSKSHLKSLKKLTQRSLTIVKTGVSLSRPVVGLRNRKPTTLSAINNCLKNLSPKAKEIFGVDQWK